MIVSDIIQRAADQITGVNYLRATDSDANISVSEIDLGTETWCIFSNLTTSSSVANGRIKEIPVEIKLLKKADLFDNTEQGDTLRSDLESTAIELRNKIQLDQDHSLGEYDLEYTIDQADQVKIYDSIMTGVLLSFNIYVDNNIVC